MGQRRGGVHYVRSAALFLPGVTIPGDVDTGAYLLFTGSGHASWLAKGGVDPKSRDLWLPFLQSMSAADARLTRYPAWLVRVNMADILAGAAS
jgi:hypothetical protein